jgi:GntR family transcriptional regulator
MEPLLAIQLDRTSGVPLRDQIKSRLVDLIETGQLAAGAQLPTIRALAIELQVNVNTVAQAYRELDLMGVIATRRGEGTFVARSPVGDELAAMRASRLTSLVAGFLLESARLGFAPTEVRAEVIEQLAAQAAQSRR